MATLVDAIDQLLNSLATQQESKQNESHVSPSRLDAINSQRIHFDNHPLSSIDVNAPFPALQNRTLLQAAFGEQPDHIPVWLHRQAGRYMQEFRDVRNQYTFFEICKTPELVAQVTLQPMNAFELDASIVFSDILVIPPILGLNVSMVKGVGPVMQKTLVIDNNDLSRPLLASLSADEVRHKLSYVYEGIKLTRHALKGKVPLIGFVGGPFTLFAYSMPGKASGAKKAMYQFPEKCKQVLRTYTDAVIAHLVGQCNAGAQALEVFESNAGELSPNMFREFVMPELRRIYVEVKRQISNAKQVPMILFAREVKITLDELHKNCGYEVYAVGWGKDTNVARREIGHAATLQGNLDPWCLFGSDDTIKQKVYTMLDEFDVETFDRKRLIVNLGHGMMPGMRPQSVAQVIQCVRQYELDKFTVVV